MISNLKKFLTNLLQVPEPDPLPAAAVDDDCSHHIRRLHPRHGPLHGAVTFQIEGYSPINVGNLSVGGLFLADISQDVSAYLTTHAETTGYLSILNDRKPITISLVNLSHQTVNCRILHDDQATILWMIPYLNLLRQGTQLKQVPKQAQRYEAGDLSVTASEAGLTIESLSPPFKVRFSTSQALATPEQEADQHALRLAVFVVLGFTERQLPPTIATLAEYAIAQILEACAEAHTTIQAAS